MTPSLKCGVQPAMGAEGAAKEAGLQDRVLIIRQGAARDMRATILIGGPLNASVAYFPERDGERLLSLTPKVLSGAKVPLTSYTDHVVVTSANLRERYPDD
jgi:ABC-type sugar transport system substrate-binding protein